MKKILLLIIAAAVLASCGSTKNATSGSSSAVGTTPSSSVQPVTTAALLQKISDNAVKANCIVADLDFTMTSGSKNITVGGKLQMKKDDVIRVQLVAFGLMEVGRLEFTKDYVLIQDKLHKKYVQEDYNQVNFLKENGLDFYALQALLWNQLYVPGKASVSKSDLKEFQVQPVSGSEQSNIVLDRGSFCYKWLADNTTNLLEDVNVDYKSNSHGSTNVNCKYSKFVKMGDKQFPRNIQLSLQTTAIKSAKKLTLGFALSDLSNSEKWETRTAPSKKYEKISVSEMLNLLMNI